MTEPAVIDTHGHVTSPELFKRFPMPPSLADVDGMIQRKLALGIDMTIIGSPVGAGTMVPVPGLDNYAQPTSELEAFHEWVAELVRSHQAHLRGYVYVNPFGGDDELDRAAKRLAQPEFVGMIVSSSVRGEYLGSPAAGEFFALADQASCPVLVHPPAKPVGVAAMHGHLGLIEHVTRPCDVTSGVASIVFGGWLDKYPGLKIIAPNAGAALPLLPEKLDLAQQRTGPPAPASAGGAASAAAPLSDGAPASTLLRNIYVDTATPSAAGLAAAVEIFGAAHVLFGTDSPPLTTPLNSALAMIGRLDISQAERDAILGGNAVELFGLSEAA